MKGTEKGKTYLHSKLIHGSILEKERVVDLLTNSQNDLMNDLAVLKGDGEIAVTAMKEQKEIRKSILED